MSDIFISYAREDLDRVQPLAEALESCGWSVFWDRRIPLGKPYQRYIEEQLDKARCVVVAWSEASGKSQWVGEEAEDGKQRKILVPILLESVRPPLGFRQLQTASLVNWTGSTNAPGYRLLVDAIMALVGKSEEDTAEATTRPAVFRDSLADGSDGPEMVIMPAGRFMMGSPMDEEGRDDDEGPQHEVAFEKPFALGRYPVTLGQYDRFAAAALLQSSKHRGRGFDQQPAIDVSWFNAVAYTEWLSEQTGRRYRLPTEAEWEYAARGGTTTAYWWDDKIGRNRANCFGCGNLRNRQQGAPLGSLGSNPYGLYDTAGTVWEWVQDCWHDNYQGAPPDGSSWEAENHDGRVVRGGSCNNLPTFLRSASRSRNHPHGRSVTLGFRLAREIE